MGILRNIKQDALDPTVGPARQAFEANRTQAKVLATELAERQQLHAAVVAALASEQAKLAAVPTARERVEHLEAALQAMLELEGESVGLIDTSPASLTAARQQLKDAEREATPAVARVRVEQVKRDRLQAEIDRLRAAVSDCQRQHGALALASLREDLHEEIVPYSASRDDVLMVRFDKVFALAIACDRLAQDLQTGEFVNSQTWQDLCIPTPGNMAPLPYSQAEHGRRLEAAATQILREYGLHE